MCSAPTMNGVELVRADGGLRADAACWGSCSPRRRCSTCWRRCSIAAASTCTWPPRRRAAPCGSSWVTTASPATYYTMLYAALGVGVPGGRLARWGSSRPTSIAATARSATKRARSIRGRGLPAFQCGNGILCVALLAAFMQGLAGLAQPRRRLDRTSSRWRRRSRRRASRRSIVPGGQLAAVLHRRRHGAGRP